MLWQRATGLWVPRTRGRVIKSAFVSEPKDRRGKLVVNSAPFGHGRKGGGGGSIAGQDPYLGQPFDLFSQYSMLAATRASRLAGQAIPTLQAAPVSGVWTNMPNGLTTQADTNWDQAIPSSSSDQVIPNESPWRINHNFQSSGSGASQTTDGAAPLDSGNVLQIKYNAGFNEGGAPATLYFNTGGQRHVYIGFYHKYSDPWQFDPAPAHTDKVFFQFFNGHQNDFYLRWTTSDATASTSKLQICTEASWPAWGSFGSGSQNIDPNQTTTHVSLGTFMKYEVEAIWSTSTSSANGTLKWWLDGVLQGSYTNVNFPQDNSEEFQISPTWGGNGGNTKSETDYAWYNHLIWAGA